MVAFTIFWRDIYRYGIFYLIGFVLDYLFLYRIGKKQFFKKFPNLQKLLEADLETLFIILILWVLIWWRVGHVLIYDFQYFVNNPLDIFKIRQWWMSFIGWILWVILWVTIFIWKKRFSRKEYIILLDLMCCILPLCIAFWRLWNFLNQELYWIIFNNPFWRTEWTIWTLTSLWFLHIYYKIDSMLRINTNLLSIIFEWILLFITLIIIFIKQIKNNKRKIWKLSMIFLLRYSLVRFLFEYLRQDSQAEFIWPFSKSQRFFVIFIILWIIWTIFMIRYPKENLENKKKSHD
jgi:phosphatidylglycerol:prolipoprotein diacylglycerol transferase